MRINELMIGNFVTINNGVYHPKMKGIPCAVTSIEDKGDEYSISLIQIDRKPNTFYESYSQFSKYVEPIPITEEWLLKFGFNYEKTSQYGTIEIKGHYVFSLAIFQAIAYFYKEKLYLGVYTRSIHSDYKEINLGYEIAFVHQLQNLFFALTGEELAIKTE